MTERKSLWIIECDDEHPKGENRYQYSDALFDWFYSRAKYYTHGRYNEWDTMDVNLERTREDNAQDGCRIFLNGGRGYIKIFEVNFLLEFTYSEMQELRRRCKSRKEFPTVEDVVNYFYNYVQKPVEEL